MRNKIHHLIRVVCIIHLATGALAYAQEQEDIGEEPPPIPAGGRPEYNPKKLPNDTFKPSEKISEDFPVPFPVDI